MDQLKIIEQQIKIIEIKQQQNELKLKNTDIVLGDIKNTTVSQTLQNIISNHFNVANLVLTKFIYETNILIEIIQMAKIGQVHPSLISPTELLEQLRDIKISLHPIGWTQFFIVSTVMPKVLF